MLNKKVSKVKSWWQFIDKMLLRYCKHDDKVELNEAIVRKREKEE